MCVLISISPSCSPYFRGSLSVPKFVLTDSYRAAGCSSQHGFPTTCQSCFSSSLMAVIDKTKLIETNSLSLLSLSPSKIKGNTKMNDKTSSDCGCMTSETLKDDRFQLPICLNRFRLPEPMDLFATLFKRNVFIYMDIFSCDIVS